MFSSPLSSRMTSSLAYCLAVSSAAEKWIYRLLNGMDYSTSSKSTMTTFIVAVIFTNIGLIKLSKRSRWKKKKNWQSYKKIQTVVKSWIICTINVKYTKCFKFLTKISFYNTILINHAQIKIILFICSFKCQQIYPVGVIIIVIVRNDTFLGLLQNFQL